MEDPKIIKEWIKKIEDTIQQYRIQDDDIWNFDETSFTIGICSIAKVIISLNCHKCPCII